MNNKGFSLVELIIVIACIAILGSALSVQVVRYINKAAVTSDEKTCRELERNIYTLLCEDQYHDTAAYNYIEGVSNQMEFFILERNDRPFIHFSCEESNSDNSHDFIDGFYQMYKTIEGPKQAGKKSYYITITIKKEIVEGGAVYAIEEIHAKTTTLDNDQINQYYWDKGFS